MLQNYSLQFGRVAGVANGLDLRTDDGAVAIFTDTSRPCKHGATEAVERLAIQCRPELFISNSFQMFAVIFIGSLLVDIRDDGSPRLLARRPRVLGRRGDRGAVPRLSRLRGQAIHCHVQHASDSSQQ